MSPKPEHVARPTSRSSAVTRRPSAGGGIDTGRAAERLRRSGRLSRVDRLVTLDAEDAGEMLTLHALACACARLIARTGSLYATQEVGSAIGDVITRWSVFLSKM